MRRIPKPEFFKDARRYRSRKERADVRPRPWLWRVDVTNERGGAVPIDAILVQDLGLGVRPFVTNNEAYASQYIDHHIARHGSGTGAPSATH